MKMERSRMMAATIREEKANGVDDLQEGVQAGRWGLKRFRM